MIATGERGHVGNDGGRGWRPEKQPWARKRIVAEAAEGRGEGQAVGKAGALLKVASRKKSRSFGGGRVYACMRGRDTRPLYEQYLMDCIGRAQTLNLTFTIIAALRGGGCARARARRRESRRGSSTTMLPDVNFIILAKKLRPGSSPSDRFSRSFCDVSRPLPLLRPSSSVPRPFPKHSLYLRAFHFEFFFALIILPSVRAHPRGQL